MMMMMIDMGKFELSPIRHHSQGRERLLVCRTLEEGEFLKNYFHTKSVTDSRWIVGF